MTSALSLHTMDWERASWQEAYAAVEQFTDRLGVPVDPGIFETVVLLNLLGFRTFQSCEGHLDQGACYPWVTIIDPERHRLFTKQWMQVCELEAQAKAAKTQAAYDVYLEADICLRVQIACWEAEDSLFVRLTALLNAFYTEQKESLTPSRLLIKRFKSPGMYRIAPGFSQTAEQLPDEWQASYLARGQAEMQAFTVFLKHRYQAKVAGRDVGVE